MIGALLPQDLIARSMARSVVYASDVGMSRNRKLFTRKAGLI